jgi:hypothetical protein
LKKEARVAKLTNRGHIVAYEKDCSPSPIADFVHFSQALFLEFSVTDGENFVHNKYFRLEVRCHRKRQPYIHSTGIPFHRRIEELFDAGEVDDGVELFLDFGAFHAEDGAIEEDIFAAGEFGVEAGADFEERADAAVEFDGAGGGFGDAGEDFEEGGLAGAVAADDAHDFTGLDVEGDVLEGPEVFGGGGGFAAGAEAAEGRGGEVGEGIAEGFVLAVGVALVGDAVFLAEVVDADGGL